MYPEERLELINASKGHNQIIYGKHINLQPYSPNHTSEIVRLRNQEKSRYFLNQREASTIESQSKWYTDYVQRNDDINWCISNKSNVIIGNIRLYSIDSTGSSCEEGGFIIDDAYAMSGPYALEAKIIVFDFAFNVLQMNKVINVMRIENKNMISIGKRMGFQFIREFEKNEAFHNIYELTQPAYNRDKLIEILDKWIDRA